VPNESAECRLYGFEQTKNFFSHINNVSLSLEDRIKITPTFALIGGLRVEEINVHRTAFDVNGVLRSADGYSKTFTPVTGRIGYTWEAVPGLTFYSLYATAADPAANNIFNIRPNQLVLTTSRTYETGLKQLFWNNRAEWTFSAFDIERNNVIQSKSGHLVNVASNVHAKGIEIAGAVRPTDQWKLWANVAFIESKYGNFIDNDTGEDFTGKTSPNVPRFIGNVGTSYRFVTRWPVEVGGSVRHVGARFMGDDNLVIMNSYTIVDAFAFIGIPRMDNPIKGVNSTRIGFRVRNLTDKKYAIWADPGYPDQVLLGAPRSYEVSAAFKW